MSGLPTCLRRGVEELWLLGGIVASAISYWVAAPGGTFLVFTGAIGYGLYLLGRGLIGPTYNFYHILIGIVLFAFLLAGVGMLYFLTSVSKL